jgi:hypothetical protein
MEAETIFGVFHGKQQVMEIVEWTVELLPLSPTLFSTSTTSTEKLSAIFQPTNERVMKTISVIYVQNHHCAKCRRTCTPMKSI